MPEKYTPNLDEIKRCWGLKVDTHKRPEREAEFDRAIAKVKADAIREAAEVIESEAADQWRQDAPPIPMPGAQLIAQRMDIMARVLRERADRDKLEREW